MKITFKGLLSCLLFSLIAAWCLVLVTAQSPSTSKGLTLQEASAEIVMDKHGNYPKMSMSNNSTQLQTITNRLCALEKENAKLSTEIKRIIRLTPRRGNK